MREGMWKFYICWWGALSLISAGLWGYYGEFNWGVVLNGALFVLYSWKYLYDKRKGEVDE